MPADASNDQPCFEARRGLCYHFVHMRVFAENRASLTWLRLALIVFLLGAFALRLQALTRQDIWWDEARNIDVALLNGGNFTVANARFAYRALKYRLSTRPAGSEEEFPVISTPGHLRAASGA